ncbi:esterase/lipase family protein [Streptomyces sp. NBC_01451]|uniref:esterase/lipase family protein n=1 Tax=Streptomyces sp. NBC_01451 TaxID=2903872 RepID=UPI002E308575|nr:hypothetical protein [Streptomyces sp. NBC_01451]
MIRSAQVIAGMLRHGGYGTLRWRLSERFQVVSGAGGNLLEFPYDWRLDNRISAEALGEFVAERLHNWRAATGYAEARVILLAHSMGGLVARYWLEVLGGRDQCRILVTFGTPHRGAVKTLGWLADGPGALRRSLRPLIRSLPSVHQLLPMYPAVCHAGEWYRPAEAPVLPGIDPERARDGLVFLREITYAVDRQHGAPSYQHMTLAGTFQRTWQSAEVVPADPGGETLRLLRSPAPGSTHWLGEPALHGDGTVPLASAVPVEQSLDFQGTIGAGRHGSLPSHERLTREMLGRLTFTQAHGLEELRGEPDESADPLDAVPACGLTLEVAYEYAHGEPVLADVTPAGAEAPEGVRAMVEQLAEEGVPQGQGGLATREADVVPDGDGWALLARDLAPGLYRMTVAPCGVGPRPDPVSEVFRVTGPFSAGGPADGVLASEAP